MLFCGEFAKFSIKSLVLRGFLIKSVKIITIGMINNKAIIHFSVGDADKFSEVVGSFSFSVADRVGVVVLCSVLSVMG